MTRENALKFFFLRFSKKVPALIDIPKIGQNWGAVYRKQQLIRIHRRFSLFLKANNKANVF